MTPKKETFEEILKRHGFQYVLACSVIFYVLGILIFNVYLRRLGSFEFDFLQLRYMFVGLAFVLITAIFPIIVWTAYGIVRFIRGPEPEPSKRLTPMQKSKITRAKNAKTERIMRRWKIAFFIFLPLWLAAYSWFLFPTLPSGFGGARPYAARLIGTADSIRKINDQIAFAAGIPAEKLPFEQLPGVSGLTTGANVLILDKSSSRIFLLLTRDLYLSSTSSFAKKMLELGKISDEVAIQDIESFQVKPLIVSSDGVDGITLSLYEPDTGTSVDDLQLAAEIVALHPSRAQEVSDVISEDLPGVGEMIVAAVQEHENPTEDILPSEEDENSEEVIEIPSLEEVINVVIEESVDTTFLDFRELGFNQAVSLMDIERRSGEPDMDRRRFLIQTVTEEFKNDFPSAWAQLDPNNNFLIIGQTDIDFAEKVKNSFRGAGSAEIVMDRLNVIEKTEENPFVEIQAGAKKVFENAPQANTQENREFMAQVLRDYFNTKAARYRDLWAGGYIERGIAEELFFENLLIIFTEPTDWEEFKTLLDELEAVRIATCEDDILNQDETEIDCGGVCDECVVIPEETCEDGILNQDETEIDCGGACDECVVIPEETCEDGILNQDETEIDCGGVCDECVIIPKETCEDDLLNQDETEIDCGGVCDECIVIPEETCEDGILNQDETDIDCGGVCLPCEEAVEFVAETCEDEIQNQDEEGIDCGGSCANVCE